MLLKCKKQITNSSTFVLFCTNPQVQKCCLASRVYNTSIETPITLWPSTYNYKVTPAIMLPLNQLALLLQLVQQRKLFKSDPLIIRLLYRTFRKLWIENKWRKILVMAQLSILTGWMSSNYFFNFYFIFIQKIMQSRYP